MDEILPHVRAVLEKEYGSLDEARTHFKDRFGRYATRIMIERNPRYLDPIIIKPIAGGGVNFWDQHVRDSWSLTEPRSGSMVDLLTRRGLIDPYARTTKIAKVPKKEVG